MSEVDHEFWDEVLVTPEEFAAIVHVPDLPPLEILCSLSHPMYFCDDRWRIREDGRLAFVGFTPEMGGGGTWLPPKHSWTPAIDVRALLIVLRLAQRLWELFPEDERPKGPFDLVG